MADLDLFAVVFVVGVVLGVLVSWTDVKMLFGFTFVFGAVAGMTILNLPKYMKKERQT